MKIKPRSTPRIGPGSVVKHCLDLPQTIMSMRLIKIGAGPTYKTVRTDSNRGPKDRSL